MLASPDLRPVYRVVDVNLPPEHTCNPSTWKAKTGGQNKIGSRSVWTQSETKRGERKGEDQGDGRGGEKIGGARRGGKGRRGIKNLLTTLNLTWPKGKVGTNQQIQVAQGIRSRPVLDEQTQW